MTTKKIPASKLSFSEAVAEVEDIVARLESEQIDIDGLTGEVQRAVDLIAACRARLERTDIEVRELVARLAPAAGSASGPVNGSESPPDKD
ncbi:MAG: exodeoxyribonuclease VII small subunit [Candidatus Krumholzibacteria bacterium]|nr:exodeoxyribonuclease VII small subunit [Candidatus Krumholzibacteria bacterium]